MKYDDKAAAIRELKLVVDKSEDNEENNEWRFKACKQIMKISVDIQDYDGALQQLSKLIELLPKVSRIYSEESLIKIVMNYSIVGDNLFVTSLYDMITKYTLESSSGSNDRLFLKISLSKLNYFLENGDYAKCPPLIKSINEKLAQVSEAMMKSYVLEAIACEIEYESHMSNVNLLKLNQLYRKSLKITTAVTHPKILGTIRESGGKVSFYRGDYEKARTEFYECFKNYDEAGSSKKKKILKYLTLCSLLTGNEFNPFESQETQTYAQLPEFSNLLLLMQSYDDMDLKGTKQIIEHILISKDELLNDDIFLNAHEKILLNLKSKAIMNLFSAFRTIKFESIRQAVDLSQEDLETHIMKLVNSGKLTHIKIDFVNGYVESTSERNLIFPLSLRSEDIYYNLKAINMLDFNSNSVGNPGDANSAHEDRMDVDNEREREYLQPLDEANKQSILTKFLFASDYQSDKDWLKAIDSWYRYLVCAIPPAVKSELSQKDQIFSEQRAEKSVNHPGNTKTDIENDVADQSTNAGILSSTINGDIDDGEDDEYCENVSKVDLLTSWYKELQKYYNSIASK